MPDAALPEVPNVGTNAFSGFGEPMPGTMPVVPEIASAKITSPRSGETVPAVFDILGTGAPGTSVTLWYQFTDPAGPAQSTEMSKTVDEEGNFAYDGSTPSDPGQVDWWVETETGPSGKVSITVEPAEGK